MNHREMQRSDNVLSRRASETKKAPQKGAFLYLERETQRAGRGKDLCARPGAR